MNTQEKFDLIRKGLEYRLFSDEHKTIYLNWLKNGQTENLAKLWMKKFGFSYKDESLAESFHVLGQLEAEVGEKQKNWETCQKLVSALNELQNK